METRTLLKALAKTAVVFLVALVVLFSYAQLHYSSSYLLLPDSPHALAPIVKVAKARQDNQGGIYFVDVIERRATLSERYLPFLRRDATLVSKEEIGADNVSDKQRARIDAASMVLSKKIAEAVALRSLGYKVVTRALGARIEQVAPNTSAAKKLLPGDVITAVNGKSTAKYEQLRALITRHRPGERVRVTFLRDGREHTAALRTYASKDSPPVTFIGVAVSPAASVCSQTSRNHHWSSSKTSARRRRYSASMAAVSSSSHFSRRSFSASPYFSSGERADKVSSTCALITPNRCSKESSKR